jgi:hypothetical protein
MKDLKDPTGRSMLSSGDDSRNRCYDDSSLRLSSTGVGNYKSLEHTTYPRTLKRFQKVCEQRRAQSSVARGGPTGTDRLGVPYRKTKVNNISISASARRMRSRFGPNKICTRSLIYQLVVNIHFVADLRGATISRGRVPQVYCSTSSSVSRQVATAGR